MTKKLLNSEAVRGSRDKNIYFFLLTRTKSHKQALETGNGPDLYLIATNLVLFILFFFFLKLFTFSFHFFSK